MTNTKPDGYDAIFGRSITNILKSDRSGIVDETKKYIFEAGSATPLQGGITRYPSV